MRVSTTLVVFIAVQALGAQPAPARVARLDSMMQVHARLARTHRGALWPGFNPETIPVAFVFDGKTLLFNWDGPLPAGFTSVANARAAWRDSAALGAASTSVRIGDRLAAQVVVRDWDAADLIPIAFHEAFHVFQSVQRKEGRRFGAGENSFYVASYPVFDVTNEALFALETRILATALETADREAREVLGRQFVAVRRNRHRRLVTDFAEFDRASELNEGLAEYVLVRVLGLLAADREIPASWRSNAASQLAARTRQLANVTSDSSMSLRLRYYHTGPAIARLLDELDPSWKGSFVAQNMWLEDALAEATGLNVAERMAFRAAHERFDTAAQVGRSRMMIARLQAQRRARADSVLATPGVLLVVRADSLPSKNFNMCGFDPQNLLQVTDRVRLQTRWWRPCSGGPTYVEFNVPSVHDAEHGTLSGVIGAEGEITITAAGVPVALPQDGQTLRDLSTVKLVAPRASIEAVRADISRNGRVLTVVPKRAP